MKQGATKVLEIRDRHTRITAIAIRLEPENEAERWLFSDAGYTKHPETQKNYVFVVANIRGGEKIATAYDPYKWDNDTMREAHRHIAANFETLKTGDVVCCEHLRGERATPKTAERLGLDGVDLGGESGESV